MAVEADTSESTSVIDERPFAHLRATPEQRARILAGAQPFDAEAWLRDAIPPTPEELADLDEFLREREDMRQQTMAPERRGE